MFNYAIGFIIASFIQGCIIFITESLKFTKLGVKLSIDQLLMHFIAGLIFGFLFLFLIRRFKSLQKLNFILTGVIIGGITWFITLSINVILDNINNPLKHYITLLTSLFAFIIYGLIVSRIIYNTNNFNK